MNLIFKKLPIYIFANYRGLSIECYWGIFLSFLDSTFGGICFFLTIYFVNFLDLTVRDSGIIMACYGLGTLLGGFFGGKLCDKVQSQLISAINLLLQSLIFFILIKVKTITVLSISLFIFGFNAYSFLTANTFWILSQCSSNQKEKAVALIGASSNLGLGLSAIVISSIKLIYFSYLFCLNGIVFLLVGIFSLSIKETKIVSTKKIIENKYDITSEKSNYKIFIFVLSNVFFIGLIISQLSTTYPLFIKDIFHKEGLKAVGFLFAINSFLVVFAQPVLISYFSKFRKITSVGLGSCLVGGGISLLIVTFNYPMAILSCIVYTIGEILFSSMTQLLCYESIKDKKGYALGLHRATYASSLIIGSILGSYLYQNYQPNTLWYASGAIGLIYVFLCFRVQN